MIFSTYLFRFTVHKIAIVFLYGILVCHYSKFVPDPTDATDCRKMLVTQGSISSISSWASNPTLDLVGYEDIQEEEGVEEDVYTLAKGEPVPRVDIDNRRVISKG